MNAVQPLTRRQREILDYLQSYIHQHGYAPKIVEIVQQFGLKSLAAVHAHLNFLESKGFIKRRRYCKRAIELLTQHRHCPTCTCQETQA